MVRKTERLTDAEIVSKVRRFGPLTTPQLLTLLGLSRNGRIERLRRCQGLKWRLVDGVNVWSA